MLLKLFTSLKIICSVKYILFQIIPNDLITWATVTTMADNVLILNIDGDGASLWLCQ